MEVIEHETGWMIVDNGDGQSTTGQKCHWTGNRWMTQRGNAMIYPTCADAEADIPNLPPPPG